MTVLNIHDCCPIMLWTQYQSCPSYSFKFIIYLNLFMIVLQLCFQHNITLLRRIHSKETIDLNIEIKRGLENWTQKIQKRDGGSGRLSTLVKREWHDSFDFMNGLVCLGLNQFWPLYPFFLGFYLLGTPDTSLRGLRTLIDLRIFRSTISSDFLCSSVCSISPSRVMYLRWGFY